LTFEQYLKWMAFTGKEINSTNARAWAKNYGWVVTDVRLIIDKLYSTGEFPTAERIMGELFSLYPPEHLPRIKKQAFLLVRLLMHEVRF